ncbi:ATP-dependent nuclease [Rhizobium leguminosarum]|uniref:ATP-dependent nuclease n=1 Tax=Rhizobium leguminosarum TaxID=384 RepID=UPI001C9804EE|nr:ATP-dependent endonuclease [Rhizobium leguminosarum]MBY5579476.1 AAA family ATPase [Rhizobium leguminosarum]MBY5611851.1 AAA family ATPase [Rhizobium leguminosarum]MBY5658122.1 AAA family ATPase [Rhizobium leguminosarum]
MTKLTNARVEGFRLLDDIQIAVEAGATVVVGRNNSGKTSLTEVFDRFLGEQAGKFRLEDFAAAVRPKFLSAKALRDGGEAAPDVVLTELPVIALTLTFTYDQTADDLGPLSPFVIDLDPDCVTAIARIEYSPALNTVPMLLDLPELDEGANPTEALFHHLRDAIPKAYSIRGFAIDPTDHTNRRAFDKNTELAALIHTGFVKAQRTLDLGKRGDTDVIGKLLNKLFKTANTLTASVNDQEIAQGLKASVADLEQAMQGDFDERLKALLPALNTFGFPSLNDTELRPQTTIDVESLLTDNTRILYTGADGIHLPEGYNGLGTRNLIYILLQLEALHKAYRGSAMRPATHLVFIEEPEAHLHPQMQEVFIGQLNEAVATLSLKYPGEPAWQVQFIVSTHSSHLANAAHFDAIRYFLNEPTPYAGVRRIKVKDFRRGAETISAEDRRFLQQYMTLTKCDLYFADKAILVEGATERILMPRISKIVDADLPAGSKLGRQYITTIEAGGAHAQVFYPLLEFLELKTLVISDLDAVKLVDSKWRKCPCADGQRTSNSALKTWFNDPQISVQILIAKTAAEKTKRFCRIAYQMSEEGSPHCARSYEDALILANLGDFGIANDSNAAANAWEAAQDFKKSEEAIKFAVREENWNVPRYIREGLVWLSEPPPPPDAPPPIIPEGGPEEPVA